MHQQAEAGRPAVMAQPLGWPHRGQGGTEVTEVSGQDTESTMTGYWHGVDYRSSSGPAQWAFPEKIPHGKRTDVR